MNSSRTVSRVGVDLTDSGEDHTHSILAAVTHDPSMQSNNAIAQEEKTKSRPRRSTAKYRPWTSGCPSRVPAQAKKRRHTTAPDNETIGMRGEKTPEDGPQRSTSLQMLPSEAKRRRTARPHPELAEVQEVQELLKTPSTDLRVEDPAHSSSMSISTLTRHFSMPLLETTIGDIPTRVAGSMVKYWKTFKGGYEIATQTTMNEADIPSDSQGQMGESSEAQIENVEVAHLSLTSTQSMSTATTQPLVSDAPTLDEEQMDSSYIRCDTSDDSEDSYEEVVEDKQGCRQTNSASSSLTKGQESQTALEEQPPPPLTGHPAARQGPYRPNVLPRNPIQKHYSALVWDSRSQKDACLVTLDNGADPNFISYETATRLGYSPLELHQKDYQLFSTLSGIEDLATQYIWLDIKIPKLKIPREACCLLVVQSSEIDIILGYYYLSEHEVFQRLVGSAGHPSAYAIISKKPTQGMALKICRSVSRNQLTCMTRRTNPNNTGTERRASKACPRNRGQNRSRYECKKVEPRSWSNFEARHQPQQYQQHRWTFVARRCVWTDNNNGDE
jgi:hypothetical protein